MLRFNFFVFILFGLSCAQANIVEYSYQSYVLFDSNYGESPVLPAEATQVNATFIIDDAFLIDDGYTFSHCYQVWVTCSRTEGMIDWVITDGATTFTHNDPYFEVYVDLTLDEGGEVVDWYFFVKDYETQADTPYGENHLIIGAPTDNRTMYCSDTNPDGSCRISHAAHTFNGGTWTATVVPIPAALWLFASALTGLGWIRRKAA